MKRDLSIGLLAFALGACVTSPSLSPAEMLAANMADTFETAIGSDDAMRDRRIEIAPLGAGEWLYYQVNHKSDLSVYRQRILQLEALPDGRVRQTAWTFNDAAAHVDLWDKPDVRAALSLDDLSAGLEDGCAQIWTRDGATWAGKVDPDRCIITSTRRGAQIRIGADSLLDEASLSLAERGFELGGEQLWGTDPGDYYRLTRAE
ncbi:MAG: chromophore lyase CpcT/CpeT [Alphaproteobacteria bacterium]|nr:chromophore lyase CpcT/CpeT [Alphaproteobacteria bacterium]